MTTVGSQVLPIDWEVLATSLRQFSAATGLCVSAFDQSGDRKVGPFFSRKVAALIARAGAFSPDGPATEHERALARQALDEGASVWGSVEDDLRVVAQPIARDSTRAGVVVCGWVFHTFPTSFGCARIARHLGIASGSLWGEARLEAPVSDATLRVSLQLLQTLMDSMVRNAQAIESLHALARLRENFLLRVSHDLRTPLSTLMLRAEILLRGPLDDSARVRGELEKIQRHVREQKRLVDDLIESARTNTGEMSIERSAIDVAALVSDAMDMVRPLAESHGVVITLQDDGALGSVALEGDADRLRQVLWNLMSNAIKFCSAGGEVVVHGHQDVQWLYIDVQDNGAGIEPAMLGRIFDPFIKRTDGNPSGLGLGLAIAKHIIERHGGTISAHSDGPGLGARISVRLPLATPSAHA